MEVYSVYIGKCDWEGLRRKHHPFIHPMLKNRKFWCIMWDRTKPPQGHWKVSICKIRTGTGLSPLPQRTFLSPTYLISLTLRLQENETTHFNRLKGLDLPSFLIMPVQVDLSQRHHRQSHFSSSPSAAASVWNFVEGKHKQSKFG